MELEDLVFEVIGFSVQSHMWHLLSNTYAEHEALEGLYEQTQEISDKLAENYLANEEFYSGSFGLTIDIEYDKEDCIEQIKEFKELVTEYLDDIEQESLKDDCIQLIKLCDTTLYMMRF